MSHKLNGVTVESLLPISLVASGCTMTGPIPHATVLKELGRRLAARRAEAHLDVPTLATRASVEARLIERFERGEGGLAVGALTRISSVLGIPAAGLISIEATEVRAPVEPSALLLTRGTATLREGDIRMIGEVIRRGRAFVEVGQLLGVENLSNQFAPSSAPVRDSFLDGYVCARQVRGLLPEYRGQPLRNLRQLIEDRFNLLVVHRPFENVSILGAACRSGPARVIILNASLKHEADIRMTLAHELGHQLKDLESDGARIDEKNEANVSFSMESPPEEKRAKAFAAMLLAPEDALHRALGPPRRLGHELQAAIELVGRARHVFGLGFDAMAWHLFNMGYIDSKDTVVAILATTRLGAELDEVSGFENQAEVDGLERRAKAALQGDLISEARYRELLTLAFDTHLQ